MICVWFLFMLYEKLYNELSNKHKEKGDKGKTLYYSKLTGCWPVYIKPILRNLTVWKPLRKSLRFYSITKIGYGALRVCYKFSIWVWISKWMINWPRSYKSDTAVDDIHALRCPDNTLTVPLWWLLCW